MTDRPIRYVHAFKKAGEVGDHDWRDGRFMGFGTEYETQESGNGIACGQVTRAIVLTDEGTFWLLELGRVKVNLADWRNP